MSPDHVAQCAELAMLFELSSSPKPGNVDRCHDFSDIGFHQFLVSAVSSYPVFRKAALGHGSVGSLILEGVQAWSTWKIISNTHFGSLVLMIPLALAARKPDDLEREVARVLKNTTVQDAIDFYKAFDLAGARVTDVNEFSLKDKSSHERLRQKGKTLQDLMLLSKDHDIVAREWSTNYERSFMLSEKAGHSNRETWPERRCGEDLPGGTGRSSGQPDLCQIWVGKGKASILSGEQCTQRCNPGRGP